MAAISHFSVRVYGLLIRDNSLLVSDELIKGIHLVKIPGGGVEFGEGLHEALRREYQEELGIDIEIGAIVSVPEMCIVSAFSPTQQVVPIYYQISSQAPLPYPAQAEPLELTESQPFRYRWIPLEQLKPELMTLESEQAAVRDLLAMH